MIGEQTQWDVSGDLYVGSSNTGYLNLRDGGVLNSGWTEVGSDASGFGSVVVSGENSRLQTSEELILGVRGTGNLTVEEGGLANPMHLILGFQDEAAGEVTIRSGGQLELQTATLGGFISGSQSASGTIHVDGDGSHLQIADTLTIGGLGDGIVNLGAASAGGVIETGSTVLAESAGSQGTLVIQNGQFITGDLVIANAGQSLALVSNGGTFHAQDATLGLETGSNAWVGITDDSTRMSVNETLTVGQHGNGSLFIQDNARVSASSARIGFGESGDGQISVSSNGRLTIANNLHAGMQGTGHLNVGLDGLVSVGGSTTISDSGSIRINGGHLAFGTMSYEDYVQIEALSGSMAGEINVTGFQSTAIGDSPTTGFDYSDVTIVNTGTLYDQGFVNGTLVNQSTGNVRVMSDQFMQFASDGSNNGEINNFGGLLAMEGLLSNRANGFIGGRGIFDIENGIENSGVMAFSAGMTDLLGDIALIQEGRIVTSGGAVTTLFDDLDHNGSEIRTSANSQLVVFGGASGAGAFTGTGDVFFEGDLRPGNSPSVVEFEGNVSLGNAAELFVEIGGSTLGTFDQLLIAGDLQLHGLLSASLLDDYQLEYGEEFLIVDVDGFVSGQFSGLDQDSIVATFGERHLRIDYFAGDGNDIALYSNIPEPGTCQILIATMVALISLRRKKRGQTPFWQTA